MRMRHQLIVVIAMVVTLAAFAASAFAQSRAADHWNENRRAAVVAAWANPIVVPTTIATAGGTATEPDGDTTDLDADGRITPPGQEKDKCVPPGQVRRDEVGSDKDTPPGQEKDKCVPPGQAKDEGTPPGLDKNDEGTPPGLDKNDEGTPPGLDKDDNTTPPGKDKDD
jgi:hypothetical protein